MGTAHIRMRFAICSAMLLAFMAGCRPARPLPSKGLVVEKVNFSPPVPFEGKTFIDIIGTLPDACTEIDDIDHTYEDAGVHVDITVSRSKDKTCDPTVTPFKETIRVETGNLYPGTYTVIVNGKRFSFPWDMEFEIPLTPDPGS